MSLYLAVFSNGREIDGWVFGHYSDFGYFRDYLEGVADRSEVPLLMEHSDCDGQWDAEDLPALKKELTHLGALFKSLPPHEPVGAFEHTKDYRAGADSLYDCFHNVDGTNLFEAFTSLCELGIELNEPILLQ